MNNKLIFAISTTGILTSVFWVGINAMNKTEIENTPEIAALKNELETLKQWVAHQPDINQKIAQLNQALEQSESQLKQIKFKGQNVLASSEPRETKFIDEGNNLSVDSAQETENILAEQQLAIEAEKVEIEARVTHLKQELIRQNVDKDWSPQTEATLVNNFADHSIEGTSLLETDCRSTYCRVVIENKSDSDFNPREILGDNVFTDSEGFYNSTVDSNGNKITELFVSRNGFNLPPIETNGFE